MIIPVIFTLDPVYENLSQTWVFYKAVSFCKRYGWPVIAQEQYFLEREKQKRILPQFFQQEICDLFEYDVPQKSDLLQIHQIMIPKKLEDRYIVLHKTQSDAHIASFRNGWEEMEDYLCGVLQAIMEQSEEKIEALTSLTYMKFLKNVSNRMGIPVIYYEWGPFRYSSYRNTAFFDLDGRYRNIGTVVKAFKKDQLLEDLPVLTTEEILALLLKENYLKYVANPDFQNELDEEYEVGIVGGYHSLLESNAYTYLNILEIYNSCLKLFDENEIAVRYHPGDPLHASMHVPNEIKGELIDFIRSCKRIVSTSNNVTLEAMLYGKVVYDAREYKYQGIANGNILKLEDRKPDLEEINFIIFTAIIPFELLNSLEYLRFRLSKPEIRDIYLYHLKYYLECCGVSYEHFAVNREQRLEIILQSRNSSIPSESCGMDLSRYPNEREFYIAIQRYRELHKKLENRIKECEKENQEISDKLYDCEERKNNAMSQLNHCQSNMRNLEEVNRQLETKIGELEEKLRHLEKEMAQLQEKYETVMNSKIMKIIRPLQHL